MLSQIQKTIEELKVKVKKNVELINKNQDAIRRMLNHSDSNDYAGQFDEFNNYNKALLSQNNDLINVQLTLINFVEKYKNTAILSEEKQINDIYSITDSQEIFDLTIKGIIPFSEKHPYFNDPLFIDKLLVYYQSIEDYEICQKLIDLKQNILS